MVRFLTFALVCAGFFSPSAGADSLTERLKEVEKGKIQDTCDAHQKTVREIVTAKLDQYFKKHPGKLAVTQVKAYSKNFRPIRIGPLTLMERTQRRKRRKGPGYIKDINPEKWDSSFAAFKWYRFLNRHWTDNYANVSSLIVDDEHRRVYNSTTQLPIAEIPAANRFYLDILKCLKHAPCSKSTFSGTSMTFMKENHFSDLAPSLFSVISNFIPFVMADEATTLKNIFMARYNGIHPFVNSNVTMLNDGRLIVEMDSGDLKGHESEIEPYLTGPWRNAGLPVSIKWVDNPAQVPEIKVDLVPGDRAYVATDLHLPPVEEASTLGHEFGHILGLPDEYYTYYDAKNCSYDYYVDYGDIMSDGEGKVLPAHIETLREIYGN